MTLDDLLQFWTVGVREDLAEWAWQELVAPPSSFIPHPSFKNFAVPPPNSGGGLNNMDWIGCWTELARILRDADDPRWLDAAKGAWGWLKIYEDQVGQRDTRHAHMMGVRLLREFVEELGDVERAARAERVLVEYGVRAYDKVGGCGRSHWWSCQYLAPALANCYISDHLMDVMINGILDWFLGYEARIPPRAKANGDPYNEAAVQGWYVTGDGVQIACDYTGSSDEWWSRTKKAWTIPPWTFSLMPTSLWYCDKYGNLGDGTRKLLRKRLKAHRGWMLWKSSHGIGGGSPIPVIDDGGIPIFLSGEEWFYPLWWSVADLPWDDPQTRQMVESTVAYYKEHYPGYFLPAACHPTVRMLWERSEQ